MLGDGWEGGTTDRHGRRRYHTPHEGRPPPPLSPFPPLPGRVYPRRWSRPWWRRLARRLIHRRARQ